MRPVELLRFSVRTFAFVCNTLACWGGIELAFLLSKRPRIDLINLWTPRWSRTNLRIFGVHVLRQGARHNDKKLYPACGPNGVGRIFVMNHRSGMDISVILTTAEAHIISRHDLAHWPLLGKSARRVGTLFVDRSSKRSGASVLKEVAQALAAGEGVAMFPEGTAHAGDEVHEFRTGAFNAARRAGAEIVPLGIAYGNDDAYYRIESFLAHMKRLASLKTLDVAIEIGEPIATENRNSIEMKDLVRNEVQRLVNMARTQLK